MGAVLYAETSVVGAPPHPAATQPGAACAETDTALFFADRPGNPGLYADAERVCNRCEIRHPEPLFMPARFREEPLAPAAPGPTHDAAPNPVLESKRSTAAAEPLSTVDPPVAPERPTVEPAPTVEETTDAPPAPEPPADDHDEPSAPADRPTDTTTTTTTGEVGQLLARHRTWWCPRCLHGRDRNEGCCDVDLIPAVLTIRRTDHPDPR